MVKTQYINELNIKKLLKEGSNSEEVKKVQEWLNLWRYSDPLWHHKVSMDGDFGPQTEAVVQAFQSFRNLQIDGMVGDQTFGALTQSMRSAFGRRDGTSLRSLIVQYAAQQLESLPRELNGANEGPWVSRAVAF